MSAPKHIMVDLETWGTTPGSDIRSIGAVVFDPVTGLLGETFYVNLDNRYYDDGGYCAPGGWMKHPLTRDPETEKWWSEQSEAAQSRLLIDQVPIADGLNQFALWWQNLEPCGDYNRFWAHGPHFDETLLAAAYRACRILVPWHYRAPRDCRTIWDAVGGVHLPFEGVEHNALDDAKHQARCVIEAYRRLRPSNTRVSELLAANNAEVERRRAAEGLLREAGEMFRMYEASHRAKDEPGRQEKAERNAEIAARIETLLSSSDSKCLPACQLPSDLHGGASCENPDGLVSRCECGSKSGEAHQPRCQWAARDGHHLWVPGIGRNDGPPLPVGEVNLKTGERRLYNPMRPSKPHMSHAGAEELAQLRERHGYSA